ncbi:uncharacterized protein QC763_511117 [Podospora pseudopauciseta]|uniref:Uncharacterized protein n=1 Tax=Podospora pseudopauciseta TaxID=2093780 RepID=A0ABR0HAP7_9PEZI|nr:hypothetical protein QC763_511117 [Podospora pseudopauciseta]
MSYNPSYRGQPPNDGIQQNNPNRSHGSPQFTVTRDKLQQIFYDIGFPPASISKALLQQVNPNYTSNSYGNPQSNTPRSFPKEDTWLQQRSVPNAWHPQVNPNCNSYGNPQSNLQRSVPSAWHPQVNPNVDTSLGVVPISQPRPSVTAIAPSNRSTNQVQRQQQPPTPTAAAAATPLPPSPRPPAQPSAQPARSVAKSHTGIEHTPPYGNLICLCHIHQVRGVRDGLVPYCNVGGYLRGECLGHLSESPPKLCEACREAGCLSWLSP